LTVAAAAVGAAAATSRGASHSEDLASNHLLRDGPPAAHTGGFGEPTCHVCHSFYDLNEGPGRLELMGLPAEYEPGRTYPIELALHHDGLRVGGFELAVRYADGQRAGKQAGTLEPADSGTAVTDSLGVQYLHHVRSGTSAAERGSIVWRFAWTAPDQPGAVRFDIAANASDNDNSELGDYVYVRSVGKVFEGEGEDGGGRLVHRGDRGGR